MSNLAAFLGLLRSAMKAAGANFPKAVATALADRDELADRVAALPSGSHQAVMAAVAAALLDDRDPLDDDQVRRLVIAQSITGHSTQTLAYGVEKSAEIRIIDALTQHADAVIADLKRAADTAGESLAQAREILGDLDLGDAAAILKLGPAAARAWAKAKDARLKIHTLNQGWWACRADHPCRLTRHRTDDPAGSRQPRAVRGARCEGRPVGHRAGRRHHRHGDGAGDPRAAPAARRRAGSTRAHGRRSVHRRRPPLPRPWRRRPSGEVIALPPLGKEPLGIQTAPRTAQGRQSSSPETIAPSPSS